MDIQKDWDLIRTHFKCSWGTNFFTSIASVDKDNNPSVTPIGSLFLNDDQSGFYFEKFPVKLAQHAKQNSNICVLAVNSGNLFWLKSLFSGRFKTHPAIKLYGNLGIKRPATEKEIKRLNRRMRVTKGMPGNRYLWNSMDQVREIKFYKAEKISLGKMSEHL